MILCLFLTHHRYSLHTRIPLTYSIIFSTAHHCLYVYPSCNESFVLHSLLALTYHMLLLNLTELLIAANSGHLKVFAVSIGLML